MTLQQQHLLHLSGATKLYNGHPVLDDISMTIDAGTATALIGRNGSGKSTLLAILAGLLKLSSGSLLPAKPKLRISYAPEAFPGLKMSAEEYLYNMGRISGMTAELLQNKIVQLLEAFQLTPFRKQAMTGYSKGMLQKVNLIQSLLGEPELLLLDEPLSGLDLPAQHTLIELLKEMKHSGTALVFSVHEPLCVEALDAGVHVLQAGRTLMLTDAGKLRDKPSSYILSTALSQQAHTAMTELTGYISSQYVLHCYTGEECMEWEVEIAWTDEFLRHILDLGGSVLSLEQRSGKSGLEQWMDPKQSGEATA